MSSERDAEALVQRADATYRAFAGFEAWAGVELDEILWTDARALLAVERARVSEADLAATLRTSLREAAITTGAIEDLYHADRGFTFSVAAQKVGWETALAEQGPHVRPLFEAQLAALDLVVDAATRGSPISEAWIRQLHQAICREQATYRVLTALGGQEQELPKGVYKVIPNHVLQHDGSLHAYCPVEQTAPEMHRLVTELQTPAFSAAHPVLQAAYAHHALVAVHPFTDGNGRVARALASVFTVRASSIPLVVYTDQKAAYLDALTAADSGELAAFVSFVLNAAVDTLNQITQQLRAARQRSANESVREIADIYRRASSDAEADLELDAAASRVVALVSDEVRRQLAELHLPREIHVIVQAQPARGGPRDPTTWRHPRSRATHVVAEFESDASRSTGGPPLFARAGLGLWVTIRRDPRASTVLRVENVAHDDACEVRRDHVFPFPTRAFRSILRAFVDRQLARSLDELAKRTRAAALQTPSA